MRVNWMSMTYWQANGYGRYSDATAHALYNAGIDILPILRDHVTMTPWMAQKAGLDFGNLTVACIPPYYLPDYAFPGRVWLLSMTEGSEMPEKWVDCINGANVERVIVPCEHNRKVFQEALDIPVHVVPGGTDPEQFPLTAPPGNEHYTFLALADRGARKGWVEVWEAFFQTFGTPTDTPNVRLIIKALPDSNELIDLIAPVNTDPRITFWIEEIEHPSQVWQKADCVVMPSRSEGWGMPHREAAMMGRPVIVTRYSGLDDGHTDCWALTIDDWRLEPVSMPLDSHLGGSWAVADVQKLSGLMQWCFDNQGAAWSFGRKAARWLRMNQTWDQAVIPFLDLLEKYN